ncbi:MAG: hypothetical protein GY701_01890, partial [Sulfitobacter sp.]|nr:hypothetical protein [Sulfitobacter sp.]
LDHVSVRYGGSSNEGLLYTNQASISVTNSEFRDSAHRGIRIYNGSMTLVDNLIEDNVLEGVYLDGGGASRIEGNTISGNERGIYVYDGTAPIITDNLVTDNSTWGIYFRVSGSGAPVITGNTVTGNRYSVILPANTVPSSSDGNTLLPNEINAVYIRGNTLTHDLSLEVLNGGGEELNTYRISERLWVRNGANLTVAPGVVVKFYDVNSYIQVNEGTLTAVGTAEDRVVFTSQKDDRYGGDLNQDGNGTAPASGDWLGLYFENAPDGSVIDHGVIRYGGYYTNHSYGNIYAYRTNLTVSNTVLANSNKYGLRSYQANQTLSNLEVFGNRSTALFINQSGSSSLTGGRVYANFGDGVYLDGSANLTVTGTELFGNLGNGLRNNGNQAVLATGNWWGAGDGPGGDGPGGGADPGAGDQVVNTSSGSIDASAFLTDGSEFSYFNAGPNLAEGTLPGPTVTRGTDSSEFGSGATTRMLFDLDRVRLGYTGIPLPSSSQYDLLVTYNNGDDTSGIGGNLQRLEDGAGSQVHGTLSIPASPVQTHYRLPPEAHGAGDLELNFIRENGYRAVVSQVWLVERGISGDGDAPVSDIDTPTDGTHLNGGLVEITGGSSDVGSSGLAGVEVGVDGGDGPVWRPVTQLQTDGDWSYRWNLPVDGEYTLYARGLDEAGNLESPGTGVAVVVNQTPPASVTGVSAQDGESDSGGRIDVNWEASADDGAGADDVTGYRLERREVDTFDYSLVTALGAGAVSASDTGVTDGTLYEYRVVTEDQAGNTSASAVYGPVISVNNTGDVTAPDEISGLVATPGNGFVYLRWIRSVDTARDLVDQVLEISTDGASWGGEISLGKDKDFYLADGLSNGQDYWFRIRTRDGTPNTSGGVIAGAVMPSETAYTTVSGTINTDTTWAAGTYYVQSNMTVSGGATLTILPGVVVKFAPNSYLNINAGALYAVGTASNRIIFTALTDDEHGGDTNGDGPSSGTPGYWSRIQFSDGTDDAASRLEQVLVRYGGYAGYGNIYQYRANVPVIDSEIRNSSNLGIYTRDESPLLQGNVIADNGSQGIYQYAGSARILGNTITGNTNGVYIRSGTPTIHGNGITGNGNYGIYFNDASGASVILGNTVTGNGRPARLPMSAVPGTDAGNTLLPNTRNQLEIHGNSLNRSLVLPAELVYYQVSGTMTVATGASLQFQPGLVWKFANGSAMTINGALRAEGSDSEKIVFTSYRDDSAGGDTNGDGASQGQPGDWARIYFSNTVIDFLTRLDHVSVRYGGSSNEGLLYTNQASISVTNSEFRDSAHRGIRIYNGSMT